jgi:hypothetical protein
VFCKKKKKKEKEEGLFYSNSNSCCISWMINYNKFRGNSANYILKFKVAEKSAPKKLILAVYIKATFKVFLKRQLLFMTLMHTNRSFNFSFPHKTVPLVLAWDPSLKFKFD